VGMLKWGTQRGVGRVHINGCGNVGCGNMWHVAICREWEYVDVGKWMDVEEWMWESGCGRVDVGEWMWENGCGKMDVGEWM